MEVRFVVKKDATLEKTQGILIRMARIGQKLTQQELGDLVGLSQQEISNIENGGGTTGVIVYRLERSLNQEPGSFGV